VARDGPATARRRQPIVHASQSGWVVGIAADAQRHAGIGGQANVDVVEVHARGAAVHFENGARRGCHLDQARQVGVTALPLPQQAPGRVGDDVHPRVVHRPGERVDGRLAVGPRRGMHGADDHVQLLQYLIGIVQRTIGPDLHFGAAQEPHIGKARPSLLVV